MSVYKVAVLGGGIKAVTIDSTVPARVKALETKISSIVTAAQSVNQHKNLSGLQVGDDHPQYTMWAAAETIAGTWNFQAEPDIEGVSLTEFIEDVVGGSLVQDSSTIYWNYGDTAGTLDANVDQTFSYSWSANHKWADNAEVQLGAGADLRLYHDGTNNQIRSDNGEIVFRMNNARSIAIGTDETLRIGNRVTSLITNIADPAIYSASGSGSGDYALAGTLFIQPRSSAARDVIIMAGSTSPTERLRVVGASDIVRMNRDNAEFQWGAGNDLRVYHDGTDSIIRNDTGILKLQQGANVALQFNSNRAFGINGANYGNSGDVLTSQGSGSPPIWAASSGGGWTQVAQSTDLVITSNNTFQTTSLSASLTAGTYAFEILAWASSHLTPDMEVRLQYTGTVTNLNGHRYASRVTTPAVSDAAVTGTDAGSVYLMDATSRYFIEYRGLLTVSDSGTFALYARQVTSSGTSVTFLAGSILRYYKVL